MPQTAAPEHEDQEGCRARSEAAPRPARRRLEIYDAYDNSVVLDETIDGAQLVVDDLELLIGFGQLQHMLRELSGWFGVESLEHLLRRAAEQIELAQRDLEGWARSAKYFEEYRRILRHVDALRDIKQTLAAVQDGFGISAAGRA